MIFEQSLKLSEGVSHESEGVGLAIHATGGKTRKLKKNKGGSKDWLKSCWVKDENLKGACSGNKGSHCSRF